jgi:hypothetical protein
MEHLFHPWHYVPIIAAYPVLRILFHSLTTREDNAESD